MRTSDTLILALHRSGCKRNDVAPREARRARPHPRSEVILLKSHPDYPYVPIEIGERSDEIARSMSEEAKTLRTAVRMQHVLRLFDASAEAYLQLNLAKQEAYITFLNECARKAWEQ